MQSKPLESVTWSVPERFFGHLPILMIDRVFLCVFSILARYILRVTALRNSTIWIVDFLHFNFLHSSSSSVVIRHLDKRKVGFVLQSFLDFIYLLHATLNLGSILHFRFVLHTTRIHLHIISFLVGFPVFSVWRKTSMQAVSSLKIACRRTMKFGLK